MTKQTAPETLSTLNTRKGPAKAPKAEKVKAVRMSKGRKEIQASLKSLAKIEKVFVKTRETLTSERQSLTGDIANQMDQVLSQLTTAVAIAQAEIEQKANALARTFINR